ncbi:membrane fraction protein [Tremella mesenterica]|uniref:Membrane fraction protein n=1 Tax=Tremella mesenterica TaxID=5217 RepID=A0A4Q1BKR0_TREME|nr:uncharacterized protein TREMEDRAFT_43257 [Tremella mesenterica DSM 1558]EIW70564.1 hypothetical protein TREMEDRAFT_43257 [Tremella mesenterica DSM 1558]RXK38250.1 membrane fraction protein [Tremella mesenterica]
MSKDSCPCGNPGSCCKSVAPVPLHRSGSKRTHVNSVWAITPQTREEQLQTLLGSEEPLDHKCGASQRADGKCCKDLKGDDERHLISPEVVRDVIIGLSDGLCVPFALSAGLSNLGSSRLVIGGGLAELCAGAISMGLGGYLASQAELDHFHYLRRQTRARVLRSCAGEMEREVHALLGPLGVKEELSRLVCEDLRAVEEKSYEYEGNDQGGNAGLTSGVEPAVQLPIEAGEVGRQGWFRWRLRKTEEEDGGIKGDVNQEMGLTPFLLKYGEGMEEVPVSRLYISALTIGISYFVGGLIPLIPYMATSSARVGLIVSSIVTGIVLFIFGGFKTYFTGAEGGYGGYLYGATSTMLVGGVAAAAAFGLVKVLDVQA